MSVYYNAIELGFNIFMVIACLACIIISSFHWSDKYKEKNSFEKAIFYLMWATLLISILRSWNISNN